MNRKDTSGIAQLAKKALAVITTSLNILNPHKERDIPYTQITSRNKIPNYESIKNKKPRPKLILKLKTLDPSSGIISMHTSHSSHSSHTSHISSTPPPGHYSHSSHSSHSSHYSSSPSYTPTTPSEPIHHSTYHSEPSKSNVHHIKETNSTINPNYTLPYHKLGSRNLFKGCIGTDVRELQLLLNKNGYKLRADGFFELPTQDKVKKFQRMKSLKIDGIVGKKTLSLLKLNIHENRNK